MTWSDPAATWADSVITWDGTDLTPPEPPAEVQRGVGMRIFETNGPGPSFAEAASWLQAQNETMWYP